jgi:hypothetical protein
VSFGRRGNPILLVLVLAIMALGQRRFRGDIEEQMISQVESRQ